MFQLNLIPTINPANLKQHLLHRVEELRLASSVPWSDKDSIKKTIATNIYIYEINFGPFPSQEECHEQKQPTKISIRKHYVQ